MWKPNRIKSDLQQIDWRCAAIGAAIVLACGIFSAALTALCGGRGAMYYMLVKPPLSPPRVLFPIVWTILYILIGGAAGAIWCSHCCGDAQKYKGLLFFSIMMVFNIVWSPLFFAGNAYFLALIDIFIMIVLTVLTICWFGRCNAACALAMAIYLVWLLFAFYLNLGIVLYNT